MDVTVIAKEIMEAANNDLHAALGAGRSMVAGDTSLQQLFWEYGLDIAIRQHWRSGHADYWRGLPATESERESELLIEPAFGGGMQPARRALPTPTAVAVSRINTTMKRFLDYQMPDGKRLGDCTRAEVERYAALLLKQSRTLTKAGGWLEAVAALIPKHSDRVRDVLREADLARLHRRALAGAA